MQVTVDVGSALQTIGVVVFALLVVGVFIMLVSRVRNFFASRSFEVSDRKGMQRRWVQIAEMLDQPGELSRKMAVLEADKLLDTALKSLAMSGETLGERLKFAQYKYPELRDVWWAHRIRNQLAHEASYHLEAGMAKSALKAFEKALKRLGAI